MPTLALLRKDATGQPRRDSRATGKDTVFTKPEAANGGPDYEYRIIWTDQCNRQNALAMAGSQPAILGLAKGTQEPWL